MKCKSVNIIGVFFSIVLGVLASSKSVFVCVRCLVNASFCELEAGWLTSAN